MVPELGLFILITAVFASALSLGAGFKNAEAVQLRSLRLATCLVIASLGLLAYSFYEVDLSVQIVYQHADHALPALYRIGAVWGGHEGSILLWVSILNLWILVFTSLRGVDPSLRGYSRSNPGSIWIASSAAPSRNDRTALMVLSSLNIGFLLFILTVSNPFARYLPISPSSGQDLNPFLQDPVMLIHPPILYMGYIGFVLPFALAIAALWEGKLEATVLRLMRSCVLVAWSFLTLGIALGSYWAYYELGWGGWWFWDPVENASLLPWIAGCALLHVVRVSQVRQGFQAWTILLCLITFSLSILGTFLVRSGALTSVHSFANDPKRGLFILCLLALTILPALMLYSLRAGRLQVPMQFSLSSREGLILINNILFMIMLSTVLLGTLYPLAIEALGLGFISVGAPYFNALIVPMGLVLAAVLGFAPFSRFMKSFSWGQVRVFRLSLGLMFLALLGVSLALWLLSWPFVLALTVLLTAWIVSQTLIAMLATGLRFSLKIWGMHLAHLGFASLILGIALTTHYSVEDEVVLGVGETYEVGDYAFTLDSLSPLQGPNYTSAQASISVTEKGKFLTLMKPEKRFYTQRSMPIAQIALEGTLRRDLYLALAEPLDDGRWILRIQVKPWVRLIWLGAIMMTAGGMMAFFGLPHPSLRGGGADEAIQKKRASDVSTGLLREYPRNDGSNEHSHTKGDLQ